MSLSLGTLEIGLGLNTAQYDAGIKSVKDQLSSLEQKVITPKVDHRPLDALNQHLTVKENHYDKLNKKIIAPKVNHVALETLNEYLTVTENRIDEFNKKVIKIKVDDTELLALQEQLEKTLALQNQVNNYSSPASTQQTTNLQNQAINQNNQKKIIDAQKQSQQNQKQIIDVQKQSQQNTVISTNNNTDIKQSQNNQQEIPVNVVVKQEKAGPNNKLFAFLVVEMLTQLVSNSLIKILGVVVPKIVKLIEVRNNPIQSLLSMPANFLKSYSEGAAYTYADIFTRNNVRAFDKEAGTDLYNTGGSDLGRAAGKTIRKGKTVLNKHLGTESAQKGSEAIADATKRTKEEMAELKKLAIEFYNTQDPSKAKEIAEQVLKVSDSMRQVAMSPIDTFANARKELKSDESIAKAKKQSATVQLDEKAVSEAKKIVFVSGGFAGKQGEGSKEIAENLQPKLEDGVLVVPIANKATDLSTSIKDNPLKWAGEAAAQTMGQGLSGTNKDSVSMLAAVIKARELNPNAQIDLLGYSAGGFVSEGATRLANQAGIENIRGVAIATPSMVGTTQIDNFSRYIGENDPIRLAEQAMGSSDVSKQSQVIPNITSHSSSDYLENAEIIKILNKEVDKLQENIEDIPDQLKLFDMSSLQLQQRELVAIETQIKEVKEATKPLEHLKVDSIVATNIPNIKLGTEEKSFEIPSISSKNNLSKNITTDNKFDSDIGVKEISKQTKDLKSLIQSNPASTDIVKAQAQADAIRKWFGGRYQKLKTLIDSGELDQAKKIANEILIAKDLASSDLEDILKSLKEAGQPTSIASGGVGASVQSAKGYLSSTGKKVQTAQETIGIKELSPIKSGLIQQIQKTGVDTTTVGFKTLFAKAIEQSAKSIASGGNKELIEANLEKLILSLNPVLANKNKTKGLGSDIIEGIKIGIKSESGDLNAEMREIALTLPKTIRDALEIQSPSKVMMRIGRDIKRGLILGLDGIKTELKFKEIEIKDFVGKVKSLDRESLKTNVQKAGKRIFNALPSNVRSEVKFRQWEMEESAKQMQPLNRETIKTNIKQVGRKVFNIGGILDKIDDFKSKSKLEQLGVIADNVEKSLDKLPEPIKKVAGLIRNAILGIVGFNVLESTIGLLNKFGKEAFQTAIEAERLEMALSLTTDDAESALSRLKVQADKLGTSFLSSAKNYQQFSAAVINTPLEFQKDKIFEGITLGLATRGASSQQQDRALLAITQIASKGRVSMEELNSQLGEAMPGALQVAARAYGVTSQEFIKLIEAGSVASDEFLSKFATQTVLESAGGVSVINDTAFAQVAKLENQLNLLRVEMGKPLLEVAKLGIPTVISGLRTLEDHGDKIVATFVSMGIVVSGVFVQMLHRLGLLKLGLKALGVTAASTKASIAQIGVGFVKGLGWIALIFSVMEAFKGLYQYINAGSEESKRSLKSTQESLQELRRLLEKPLPTPKASTVITDSATAIQRFKNNRERDKSLEFTAGGLSDTTQILRLSTDTFSDTKITEFIGKLDVLRQKAKDLKIDEIIASGDADVKKATSVRQEIAKVNQEIQALTEKYFPQIGLIVNEIASTEERIIAIKKVLDDPESSKFQKDSASIQLEIAEVQLKKLKESQEKYNEAVKENLINYQRLTEQINKVARALSNIEFISSGRTILSETDIKRQVLSGNLKPFEIDLTVKEQSLSIVKDQFNSLNGLLVTKEKELQNTLTDQINQRITELMPELNGLDFRTALQQGSVSPEAIGDRLQQLGDQVPFELKQVLETARQQASIRRQTLTIDKSIVDTELEIANARRERARNARQASIVGANVNERIATLRQLPLGGPVASYRDALSEVRNQERLLEEAYRRLESASDDPNVIQQEVDNTRLALEQARANLLQQQASLKDYYRNLDRQIVDFNRQLEDYRRQVEDAQLSAFKENRSLSESYSDLVRELDKNLLNAQNQLLDTTDRIRVQQVKNRLLMPGTSDAGKELGDIFLEFVQGQADLASRGRTFQSRTEEIETSYISTLRNIRNLQEQQQEAERNRLRTIEDIKRTQENLNRTLADLIRQTNKELGFIPQSIKDIVANLNTLPEPIKLINSELTTIPPNIKTSGEDLVKSIEETAEAIRKAKEGLILPAPSNFIPAPVWNGGGFLPPPLSQSPSQSSPSQSSPSQNNSSNSNLETNLNRLLNKHNSPLTARDFIDASQKTGVSVDALVTQALIESHFGTKGRAAKTRNPLNYGNDDAGNNKFFSTFREGLIYAAQKLKEDFFFTTPEDFISRNFRGRYGIYATDPLYGQKYRSALSNVRNELGISQPSNRTSNQPRTQAELDALQYDGNPANSGALNRIRQIRRNHGGQGGPEFSSPPPIAQIPTLPNQNQDNFWESDLPPVLKNNPDNFWESDLPPVPKDNPINFQRPNLPRVPNLPTGNLGAAADQIRNAEIANQEQEERLRQLESSFLTETTLDRIIKFRQQQEEEARALERTLRDASENVADLTINSKGYLTVQEEISKSATEVSRQYRSQIESLEDQRRTLLLNADAIKKRSEAMKDELRKELKRNPNTPISVVVETTKAINILAERAELAKEQIAILDQAIEQLGKNQGVATLEASFRKTKDTVRSIRDRLNDLTIQRMKLENQSRPTLFDDSAILAERISLQKEKEELEDYLEPYKDLPQYADFVANIRSEWEKLAELRLERVALDVSPNRGAAESFFSDIREGKGIGSAFSGLGLNIMTKFVEGITKPAIDALTSAIDGFTKPITQAFESVFNSITGPVGNFFANALSGIFKPASNIFSKIFEQPAAGGLFDKILGGTGGGGLLSGVLSVFSGGLGSLGSIGASSFASAPASAFSLGTGFSLFSDGGKVSKPNAPIEKNIISAFQRERAMSGGRKPRLIVANEDELVLNPKETEAYLEYRNNAPIKNYANGGFVGGKPNYSTTSNNNSSNQSLVINNTNNVTVESRNDMGYSLTQLKERENAQNERTKKRFFS